MKPLISIIIPNYNNAQWLPKCLDSCLAQKGDFEMEIIVVDDFSTDNSWEILEKYQKEYPHQVFIFHNQEKGGNQARNYGFSQSKGDYIQWLDSDDIILPEKFQTQLKCFNDNPDADIVLSDWRMDFYENGIFKQSKPEKKKQYDDFLYEQLINNWNPIHAYLSKKDLTQKIITIYGWNLNTKVGQDREYYSKSAILGAKLIYSPGEFSVYNRWSENTVSKVKHIDNIKQSTLLNQTFYTLIGQQSHISKDKKTEYFKILNTEIVRNLYYYRKMRFPREIKYSQVNWKEIDWRTIPIILPCFFMQGKCISHSPSIIPK